MRSVDLTPQALQVAQRGWWDEAFSQLLLGQIPRTSATLVELDCGLAAAAHLLLPALPQTRYVGLEPSPERLAQAKERLQECPIAQRVELRLAHATAIPLDPGSAQVVLSVMALQQHPDVPTVLQQARATLAPGGRLLAAEPDNLGQRFYFDGVLEQINAVFHALCRKARVARQPADIALGPHLPALLRDAGFFKLRVQLHAVHATRMESAAQFCNRLARVARTIAREVGLPDDDEAVQRCLEQVEKLRFAGIPRRVGFSGHLVPVFVCRAVKPRQ